MNTIKSRGNKLADPSQGAVNRAHFNFFMAVTVVLVVCILLYPATAMGAQYGIHVASHRTEAGAAQVAASLRSKNLDGFFRMENVPGKGLWYRVYVGRFNSMNEASAAAQSLRNSGAIRVYFIRPLEQEAAPVSARVMEQGKCGQGAFFLHVSSYKFAPDAVNAKTDLRTQGLTSFVTRELIDNQTWYRVWIGSYQNSGQARLSGASLRAKGVISYFKPFDCRQVGVSESVQMATTQPRKITPRMKAQPEPVKTTAEMRPKVKQPAPAAEEIPQLKEIKRKLAAQAKKIPEPDRMAPTSRTKFSLGANIGPYMAVNARRFEIKRTTEAGTDEWRLGGQESLRVAVLPKYKFSKTFSLEGGLETLYSDQINTFSLLVTPKLEYRLTNRFHSYVKAGLVYGSLNWKDVPGKFDYSLGWEAGLGMEYYYSKIKLGLDFMFRAIQYKYKPGSDSVNASTNAIDFSGFGFSALIGYTF